MGNKDFRSNISDGEGKRIPFTQDGNLACRGLELLVKISDLHDSSYLNFSCESLWGYFAYMQVGLKI